MLLVFLTVFDQQLILHEVLPLHGVVVFASLASVVLIVAAATRTIELGEVYSEAVHILSRFRLFAIGFLALVLLSLIHLVIPPLPSLTDALYIASPLAVCALTVLLSSIPQVRASLRSYLFVAFAVYCVTVWVDVLRPATFSAMESQASGFASNPNAGALLLVMLTAPLLNYRRLTLTSLLLLFVSGLTAFTILSRAGLLGYLVLAGCYTWMIPAPYLKRRLVNFALVGVMGLCVLSASLVSVRTLSYFDNPITKARVHLVFGTGSLEHAATIVCRVAGSEECPDWIQRFFSFEVDPLVDVTTDYARIRDLLNGLRRIKEAPILGHGPRFDGRSESGSHNMYVSVWVNLGVGAPIAYLMILMGGIWSFRAVGFRAGVALLSFIAFWSLFSHTMFDKRPLFIMLGLLLPLAAARSPERERDRDAPPPAGPGPPAHPVRVLMVSALPPPTGGVGTWTEQVLREGLPAGYEPYLVNTSISNPRRVHGTSAWAGEVSRTTRIIASLLSQLVRVRPHVVHLNCSHFVRGIARSLVCARLARIFRVPVVSHYHGDTARYLAGSRNGMRRRLLRALVRTSQVNVAMNRPSLMCLCKLQHEKQRAAVLLPNCIADSVFRLPVRTEAPRERVRVIYAGRIMAAKGCHEILAAARELPEADFVLLGPVLADMEEHVRCLPANAKLDGEVPPDVVLQQMRASDIFLLPTDTEGFPMAVLEAMAVGLPVVSTRVGAIPEMIDENEGGLLIDPNEKGKLTPTLRTLLEHPAMRHRMGLHNRRKSQDEYAYSVVISRLAAIYRQAMESV